MTGRKVSARDVERVVFGEDDPTVRESLRDLAGLVVLYAGVVLAVAFGFGALAGLAYLALVIVRAFA